MIVTEEDREEALRCGRVNWKNLVDVRNRAVKVLYDKHGPTVTSQLTGWSKQQIFCILKKVKP